MSLRDLGLRGGVRTLDDLRARCRVDEDSGCWHWLGAIDRGCGVVYLPDLRKNVMVPRAALLLSGKTPRRGFLCYAVCGSHDCCHPEHVRSGSRKAWGQYVEKSGRRKHNVVRIITNRKLGKARRRLTDEQVREIRESDETGIALAQRFGATRSVISRIRRGEIYRADDVMPGASVFTWRKAA